MLSRLPVILLCVALWALSAKANSEPVSPNDPTLDSINTYLGTQTFGIKYQFTKKTSLVETAERILEMSSNILKFTMSQRAMGDQYHLPYDKTIRSLKDLASREPSVRAVLDMPFAFYQIWVYPFAHHGIAWLDGLSARERDEAYREVFDLAQYLLTTYSATRKTFLLGHWEGDWYLHPNYDRTADPKPEAIRNMIEWLNLRQQAVDDAKRLTRSRGVKLYHYTEVNLVQKGMQGKSCLVNDVLPFTQVDYVSYSSYDTIYLALGRIQKELHAALDYIESKLPPKDGITGKRVFIGEYGYPLDKVKTAENQDRYSRDLCRTALDWGCPFVLYWEMYCNENPEGKHRGFWLVDDKNQEQPFYYTLKDYYAGMKVFVSAFREEHGRLPTDAEMREKAIALLGGRR